MVITEKSSFRDKAARVIVEYGEVTRIIDSSYLPNYYMLMHSGLYKSLIAKQLLIQHIEVNDNTIKPEVVPFISYPYEWSFNTLKEAAIVTLKIAIIALEYDMMLKDASAYNIQYHKGYWKLIDTTSFEKYEEGKPWIAYGQFIRHFYLPLVLASYYGGKVFKWLQSNIDGLNPQEYANLLPVRSYFNPLLLMHIHSNKVVKSTRVNVSISKQRVINVLNNLLYAVEHIKYNHGSEWQEYRAETPYVIGKKMEVNKMLARIGNKSVLDIGTNDSYFCKNGVAIDKDHDCINMIDSKDTLPLVIDICNPTPAIGWASEERMSFVERVNFDIVLALAIVHHLCIANNTPLEMVAELMSKLTNEHLIIEFVSLGDKNSQKLAIGRTFPDYNKELFESSFYKYFKLICSKKLTETRELYWLRKY